MFGSVHISCEGQERVIWARRERWGPRRLRRTVSMAIRTSFDKVRTCTDVCVEAVAPPYSAGRRAGGRRSRRARVERRAGSGGRAMSSCRGVCRRHVCTCWRCGRISVVAAYVENKAFTSRTAGRMSVTTNSESSATNGMSKCRLRDKRRRSCVCALSFVFGHGRERQSREGQRRE